MRPSKPYTIPVYRTRPYWYLFYIGECPVCGADASYKERQYSDRPEDRAQRYVQLPLTRCYDGCIN